MPSKWRFLSPLLVLCGVTILVLIIIRPPQSKFAIVGSTLGLLSTLAGIYLLDERDRLIIAPSMPWLRYIPLPIGIAVSLLALLAPPPAISAFALPIALTLLFPLSRLTNVSKVYIAFLAVLLAASIGYNMFCYYPLISGNDPWADLSTASAIFQRGHYSDVIQPTDRYYFPFPVMGIDASIFSSVTGLNLESSLLLCPGSLILLQPLLVFLLSRLVFDDDTAAALSAFIVVTETTVTQWISGPIAQSVAISLLLLLLILLFRRVRSRGHVATAFVVLLMLTAMHGAVGLISVGLVAFVMLLGRSSHRRIILPLAVIYVVYIMITEVINIMVQNVQWTVEGVFNWIFTPTLTGVSELYGTGSNGLIFIWWGLPASLALFSVLVQRRKRGSSWVYAGLGLLGLSFVANVIAPHMDIDRYGGLTAWLILATTGGRALRAIARTPRQLVALLPVMLLVCLSAVADPALSPQYGFYQNYPLWPTAKLDRTALDWVNGHVDGTIFADLISGYYLIFTRYRSGRYVGKYGDILTHPPQDMPSVPGPDYALFIRSNTFITPGNGEPYHRFVSASVNQQRNQIVNIIYNDGCDVLEMSEVER